MFASTSVVGVNATSIVLLPVFCVTAIIVSVERIVLNSKSIPTFCLNKLLPVPMFETVFASPPAAPGAAAGLNFVPSQVKTSLTLGTAVVVSTSLNPLIDVAAILVSTKLFEKYKFVLPCVKSSVVFAVSLVSKRASV